MTPERFEKLESLRKLQEHYMKQELLQTMRDARANADALEGHLAKMNPAYRQAMPDARERLRRLVEQTFQSRDVTGKDVLDKFPSSYQHLREVVKA